MDQSTLDKITGECIAVRLRMINRIVTKIYDDALRKLELKVSQMNILVAIAKRGTSRPKDICELLYLDESTLSRNVERMKARGWLEVVNDDDGRAQPLRLTVPGHKLLARAVAAWSDAQQQVKLLLSDDLVAQIHQTIKRINQSK